LPDDRDASSEPSTDDISQDDDDDAPLYVISVAAKLVRLPAWTLRVLDEQGIVVPKRTGKNRRLYSDSDLSKLIRVRSLTEEFGVNMNGVRIILQLEEQKANDGSEQKQEN
jgi:MerR family transcriptional regulator/heat shock protein HspR